MINSIQFEIHGKPPLKNEAISLFSASHGQAERTRALLEAAKIACDESDFMPIEEGSVALDVITRSPGGDASNIIGGIADVLEDKSHRSSIEHLGELATVWVYRNDKQIKQITYREEPGESSYAVAVRRL